jgi:hypothetical protein
MLVKRAVVYGLFLCRTTLKYLIVNLTFIIKLHQIAITFTQYQLSGYSTVYDILSGR